MADESPLLMVQARQLAELTIDNNKLRAQLVTLTRERDEAAAREAVMREALLNIHGHLGAALVQRAASDDGIIMAHIEGADAVALSAWEGNGISATAREAALRDALLAIIKNAPENEPEDPGCTGNADDSYDYGRDHLRWWLAKIARAALEKHNG